MLEMLCGAAARLKPSLGKSEVGLRRLGGGALAACLVTVAAVGAAAAPAAPIVILPAEVPLAGTGSYQRVVVQQRTGAQLSGDVTSTARLVSSNLKVAVVAPDGTVRAVSDGVATITATSGGSLAKATVRVSGTKQPVTYSFKTQVQPILTKSGCNSGACHGASAGKGGLKLTLRGFDSPADHATLTRQALGRRINPTAPAQSLVLQKATGTIPHGGGPRFKVGSPEHAVLLGWISAGSPAPSDKDDAIRRIEVFPPAATLKKGATAQIVARAVYSSGKRVDVTRWVKFGTNDEAVAGVDDAGRVTIKASGEAAITLYYQSNVAFSRVSSPHPQPVAPEVYAKAARHNKIDDLVLAKLRELNLPPAPLATDEEFVRRAYLDAAGILPTVEETEAFLADQSADKREKLIDRLLVRPEFSDYWAYKWSDLLLVSARKLQPKGMWAFYDWIRDGVAANKPWDRLVREIITANGSTLTNGAANYFVLHKDPIDLTETTSQAFLGMALTCARCHNHPLEKWTQTEYYGFANLLSRVRMKNGDLAGETLVFAAAEGELNHPRTGQPVPPKPLDAAPMALDAPGDRRVRLAEWLTAPENPYFSRALVNRVWRNFFGRGLVEAEDDLRLTNPPSNDALLTAVATDFAREGFDVRKLIRTMMTSATYQRSSVRQPGSPPDEKYYSTYITRRLPAEVLLDGLSQATGVATDFPGYPAGTRAMQLVDSQVVSYFLSAFGRPQRMQTCSCERQEEPNVAQALHLANGDTINNKLRAKGGLAERLSLEKLTPEQLLDRLYLTCFSRRPKAEERTRVLAALEGLPASGPGRQEAIEDLLAAMLTTKEFLFNH